MPFSWEIPFELNNKCLRRSRPLENTPPVAAKKAFSVWRLRTFRRTISHPPFPILRPCSKTQSSACTWTTAPTIIQEVWRRLRKKKSLAKTFLSNTQQVPIRGSFLGVWTKPSTLDAWRGTIWVNSKKLVAKHSRATGISNWIVWYFKVKCCHTAPWPWWIRGRAFFWVQMKPWVPWQRRRDSIALSLMKWECQKLWNAMMKWDGIQLLTNAIWSLETFTLWPMTWNTF
mmetsp:Transcript_15015/g.41543  ORF Transcript_15015/g.41543 Transcript_15015/m.41543 type:complete len:229 (+) Transcript_15015:711-1397(+)